MLIPHLEVKFHEFEYFTVIDFILQSDILLFWLSIMISFSSLIDFFFINYNWITNDNIN